MKKHLLNVLLWTPVALFAAALLSVVIALIALLVKQSDSPGFLLGSIVFTIWLIISIFILLERNYRNNPDG